jgi:hypothetical protein
MELTAERKRLNSYNAAPFECIYLHQPANAGSQLLQWRRTT